MRPARDERELEHVDVAMPVVVRQAVRRASSPFERFWRAPEARLLPGSGLGLAIVADIAAALRGPASRR